MKRKTLKGGYGYMETQLKPALFLMFLVLTSLFASTLTLADSGSGKKDKIGDDSTKGLKSYPGQMYSDNSVLKIESYDDKLVEDGNLEKEIYFETENSFDKGSYRAFPMQAFWGKGWAISRESNTGYLVDLLIAEKSFINKDNATSQQMLVARGALRMGDQLYQFKSKEQVNAIDTNKTKFNFPVYANGKSNNATGELSLERIARYSNFGLWEGTLKLNDGTVFKIQIALRDRNVNQKIAQTDPTSLSNAIEKQCGPLAQNVTAYAQCKESIYKKYLESSSNGNSQSGSNSNSEKALEKAAEKQEKFLDKFFKRFFERSGSNSGKD
jgi:hypothetical protein